jgi:hypothetical protein
MAREARFSRERLDVGADAWDEHAVLVDDRLLIDALAAEVVDRSSQTRVGELTRKSELDRVLTHRLMRGVDELSAELGHL